MVVEEINDVEKELLTELVLLLKPEVDTGEILGVLLELLTELDVELVEDIRLVLDVIVVLEVDVVVVAVVLLSVLAVVVVVVAIVVLVVLDDAQVTPFIRSLILAAYGLPLIWLLNEYVASHNMTPPYSVLCVLSQARD